MHLQLEAAGHLESLAAQQPDFNWEGRDAVLPQGRRATRSCARTKAQIYDRYKIDTASSTELLYVYRKNTSLLPCMPRVQISSVVAICNRLEHPLLPKEF